MKLEVRKIGNSKGLILPREVLAQLKVDEGDSLWLSVDYDGVRLTTFDPEVAHQVMEAREIMKEDRDILRELAK